MLIYFCPSQISCDLAPSDYHFFPLLKRFLGTQRFNNDDELKNNMTNWLKHLNAQEQCDKLVKTFGRAAVPARHRKTRLSLRQMFK